LSHLKRAVIVSLFFLAAAAFAEEDLVINADRVDYDKDRGIVEASGEVIATYQDLTIEAPHIVYFVPARRVFGDKGFVLERGDQRIEGTVLDYGIDSRGGSAESVNMTFKRIFLKGKTVVLGSEEITVNDASFTSCDNPFPHYHLTAQNIKLYPKDYWLAANWGWFYLGPVPVAPVPAYVYDMGPDGKKRNAAPVPEVGSNDVDGGYAIERIGWSATRQVHGNFGFTYTSKNGLGEEVDSTLTLDEDSSFSARLGNLAKEGWYGGLTYSRSFGGEVGGGIASEGQTIIPKEKRFGLEVNGSSRERINFYRVSLLPDVALMANEDYLFDNVTYKGQLKWGRIFEEDSHLDAFRTQALLDLSYRIPVGVFGTLSIGGEYNGSYYSQGSRWIQVSDSMGIDKRFNDYLTLGAGLKHLVLNEGLSPFAYELYRYRRSDEIYGTSSMALGFGTIGFRADYYVPSWDPKDIDYFASIRAHCFDLIFTYRALRNEVQLGIGLVAD